MPQFRGDKHRTSGERSSVREDDLSQLKRDMQTVKRALYGDPDDPDDRPGVVFELSRIDSEQKQTNQLLSEIRGDIRKVVWIIIVAVIGALVMSIIKHPMLLSGG